ncbi:uncharacterized protein LACBIDRAFT_331113 [Laccaria bicolor S238N-H82]|uniref:Predicted protein n=1 Tax=Laccaria bicolor (strain S238N-H82 / ATCC MYA-4686) TaxID=486041 RepID=B0DNI3_LACBS|nr:uncharacterized protein LACBIDRAFT_331113 [Laccaria bicolor S238N-H82]EDR03942.1 predicted protein [Laccaria bicolor S238N-H82]|eukprot:XP_001885510.1 predicted protein [Laccaria bicolor S238N-H82]
MFAFRNTITKFWALKGDTTHQYFPIFFIIPNLPMQIAGAGPSQIILPDPTQLHSLTQILAPSVTCVNPQGSGWSPNSTLGRQDRKNPFMNPAYIVFGPLVAGLCNLNLQKPRVDSN